MTSVRIVAVVGSMMSALAATWLAVRFHEILIAVGKRYRVVGAEAWWWIGVPLVLASSVAAAFATRGNAWLPGRWTLRGLMRKAFGIAAHAAWMWSVLLILFGFTVTFLLAGVPLHGTQPGIPLAIGGITLVLQWLVFAAGVALALWVAQWFASRAEFERKKIEEWKRTHWT